MLSSYYRSPITYSDENLTATEKGVERLRNTDRLDVKESATVAIDAQPYKERFIEAMDDDFGTPQAVATLFDLAREINRGNDEGLHIGKALKTFRELASILGLTLRSELAIPEIPIQALGELAHKHNVELKGAKDATIIVSMLSEKRHALRREKKYQLADSIRNGLKELGITLEDTPEGTIWRYRKP